MILTSTRRKPILLSLELYLAKAKPASEDRHYEAWEKMEVSSLDGTEFGILERKDEAGNPIYLGNADPSSI